MEYIRAAEIPAPGIECMNTYCEPHCRLANLESSILHVVVSCAAPWRVTTEFRWELNFSPNRNGKLEGSYLFENRGNRQYGERMNVQTRTRGVKAPVPLIFNEHFRRGIKKFVQQDMYPIDNLILGGKGYPYHKECENTSKET